MQTQREPGSIHGEKKRYKLLPVVLWCSLGSTISPDLKRVVQNSIEKNRICLCSFCSRDVLNSCFCPVSTQRVAA